MSVKISARKPFLKSQENVGALAFLSSRKYARNGSWAHHYPGLSFKIYKQPLDQYGMRCAVCI